MIGSLTILMFREPTRQSRLTHRLIMAMLIAAGAGSVALAVALVYPFVR